jgi:hypothetical protein
MRHRHPDLCAPKQPDLTLRQRWIAAQRLAVGDTLRMAAVMANTKSAVLSLLLSEDPEFQGLIEDCRVIHAMPRDEWRARAEAFARDAAERAMVNGPGQHAEPLPQDQRPAGGERRGAVDAYTGITRL